MKRTRFAAFIAVISIAIAGLCNCAADRTANTLPDVHAVFAQTVFPPATNFSGGYLAGRFAQHRQDWDAAQDYMSAVLSRDDSNDELRERTFLLTLGSGNHAKAKELANEILSHDASDELALMFLACDDISRDDFTSALAHVGGLPNNGFGQYTKPLLTAWSLAGLGRKDEALKLLADSSSPDDPTYRIHAGMIQEMSGNLPAAEAHYRAAMANGLTLHSAVLVGNFFEREKKPDIARLIYNGLEKLYPLNPFVSALRHQDAARAIPPGVARAADGAAFALYDLTTLLYERRAYDSAQIYDNLVRMMTPDSPFGLMMTGDIAALHKQFGKAIESYESVAADSPLYWLARMRVAETYEISGHPDMAATLLQELAKQPALRVNALVTLGDMYRRREDFAGALKSYDGALAVMGPVTQDQWQVIYARGLSLERLDRWQLAEKDLLKALELQPDNPMILNFIGYSWIDKGVNTDKAMDFLKRAVSLKPDDGYILDSYGWAFYRTGQYDSAVNWIEQAVSQVPDDATILDHLGDAYWQAGRRNEARFKWRRAGEISTDQSFRAGEQEKIRSGLAAAPSLHLQHSKEAKL